MITQATISIIGVLLVLVMAWGYYTVPARKPKGRALYALLVFFAIVHLVGDGFLRALADDPMKLSLNSLNTAGVFCYMTYLGGMIVVLQIAFDIVWVQTREKVKGGVAFILQLPSVGLIVAGVMVKGTFLQTLFKYMPLLYALILFFCLVWYFDKLDKGVRVGIISSMVGCILVFVVNSVFEIASVPMLVLVLLVVIAFSWAGRGELIIANVTEEELERLQEKGYVGIETDEVYETADGEKATTIIYTDRPGVEAEPSELEKMMRESSSKKEKLSIGDEVAELTDDAVETAGYGADVAAGESGPVDRADMFRPNVSAAFSTEQGPLTPEPMRKEALHTGYTQPLPQMQQQGMAATGMQAVEPSPIDQIIAATVLTAENDSKQESAIQIIQNSEESVAETIHYRPLILEKDLNEYYHKMKQAVTGKDYDTCLEIMSEMSEYRISGIHVTRYERIRHAVVDEQWSEVEKELADF